MNKSWHWPSFLIGLALGTMVLSEKSEFGDFLKSMGTGLANGAAAIWADAQAARQTGQEKEEPLTQ